MSEIAQIILAVKNIFKAGFVAREDFLLPALIVPLCLALIFFFFRLRRLQPRTSSSLLIVLTCVLLSLGVFYNYTRELETAGLSCGDEKSCLNSLERRGSVAGEETTGNFSAIGGSASGGQSNSNNLILSKIIFTPVISGDGTVKYKSGDLQIKSNGLVRIITGAVGSREIKNGSIQDADIDDDIDLTVETIYSRGTMEAGGDLIIGGNTIVTNGQINVGDKVITQGDIGVGISVPLAKLHVHQTSPSGNEVLFLISTGDDASRFSVDEDGDFTADGNLVLGGTIDTGMGATEVYLMNQNVRTADAPTFAGLTLNGTLALGNNGIDGTNYDISAAGIITGATWNGAVIADGYIANDITLANLTQITSRSHSDLQNLLADDHTQYALLAGRSGGQTLIGGTAASETLTLQSTSHATKGKILFGTSAYDEVNNRLGIGTASPTGKLQVEGSISELFYLNQLDTAVGTSLIIRENGNNASSLVNYGTTHGSLANQTWFKNYRATGPLVFSAGGGSTAQMFIKSDGNVGIGTTSPGAALDAQTTTGSVAHFQQTGATNSYLAKIEYLDSGGTDVNHGLYIDTRSGNGSALDIYNNATSLFRVKTSGNVGIGTASPTSRIHGVTTLSAATGNEVAYQLNYTTNKAAGNDTGLLINMTDTLSLGTSLLIDAQVGGGTQFGVNNVGQVFARAYFAVSNTTTNLIYGRHSASSIGDHVYISNLYAKTNTTGQNNILSIISSYNQTSGTAANTDLLINRTQTAVGSGAQLLIDAQVGGASKFSVDNTGSAIFLNHITTYGNIAAGGLITGTSTDIAITLQARNITSANKFAVSMATGTHSQTSGTNGALKISPTYNQTSGDAANTDLLINRTQTAVGSGAQLLIDAQVGGLSKFRVSNVGTTTIFDSYTDASNYEGYSLDAGVTTADTLTIAGVSAGSGAANLNIAITPKGTGHITVPAGLVATPSIVSDDANSGFYFGSKGFNWGVDGDRKFGVDVDGFGFFKLGAQVSGTSGFVSNLFKSVDTNNTLVIQNRAFTTSDNAIEMVSGTLSGAGVAQNAVVIKPTWNQTTTSSATDLLINRTQTAVGSGAQLLIDAQVGGVSKFSVSNTGQISSPVSAYIAGIVPYNPVLPMYIQGAFGTLSTATTRIELLPFAYAMTNTTGQSYGLTLNPAYNQVSGDAANTDLLINRTQTAVGSGAQLLIDAQVGGVSKFSVSNTGNTSVTGSLYANYLISYGGTTTLNLRGRVTNSSAGDAISLGYSGYQWTNTSGQSNTVSILPTYNQASGTAANTDLLINRTQTAVGSGAQLLIDAQVGGTSKFTVSNTGTGTFWNHLNVSGAFSVAGIIHSSVDDTSLIMGLSPIKPNPQLKFPYQKQPFCGIIKL